MKRFVFWSGIYNLFASSVLLVPGALPLMGIPEPQTRAWTMLAGLAVLFLGIMLVLCSRNLTTRASMVYWEGFFRLAAFVLLAWYGLYGGFGPMAVVFGVIDLVIGVGYLLGLPKSLGRSAIDLLSDTAG